MLLKKLTKWKKTKIIQFELKPSIAEEIVINGVKEGEIYKKPVVIDILEEENIRYECFINGEQYKFLTKYEKEGINQIEIIATHEITNKIKRRYMEFIIDILEPETIEHIEAGYVDQDYNIITEYNKARYIYLKFDNKDSQDVKKYNIWRKNLENEKYELLNNYDKEVIVFYNDLIIDKSIKEETEYFYKISVIDFANNESLLSNQSNTILSPDGHTPLIPTIENLVDNSLLGKPLKLNINKELGVSYELFLNDEIIQEGIEIKESGKYKLKIIAKSELSSKIVENEINFEIDLKPPIYDIKLDILNNASYNNIKIDLSLNNENIYNFYIDKEFYSLPINYSIKGDHILEIEIEKKLNGKKIKKRIDFSIIPKEYFKKYREIQFESIEEYRLLFDGNDTLFIKDKEIIIYDLEQNKIINKINFDFYIGSAKKHLNKIYIGKKDGFLLLYNIETQKIEKEMFLALSEIDNIFIIDDKLIFTSKDNTIYMNSLDTMESINKLKFFYDDLFIKNNQFYFSYLNKINKINLESLKTENILEYKNPIKDFVLNSSSDIILTDENNKLIYIDSKGESIETIKEYLNVYKIDSSDEDIILYEEEVIKVFNNDLIEIFTLKVENFNVKFYDKKIYIVRKDVVEIYIK